jgi:transposase
MGKPYSMDLRARVGRSVMEGGLSRHRAAAQFGVAPSTVLGSHLLSSPYWWVHEFKNRRSWFLSQDRQQALSDRSSTNNGPLCRHYDVLF